MAFTEAVSANEIQELPPLTVTATRTEQSTFLASTTVITREDIERLQVQSIEQALRGVAGINIANQGGLGKTTSIFLRGTESDHVLVLIDGVKVGSVTTGASAFQFIPISEVEQIEVVRGPRSSLYGSEAIGGIIHIHTRRGADSRVKLSLSAGTGSHDHYRYSAGLSGNIQDSWYNIHASHEQSHGFNACSSGLTFGCFADEPDDDGFRNEAGSVRLGHRFSDWLTVEGHALYSDGDTQFDGSSLSGNQADFVQQIIGGQIKIKPLDFWTVVLKGGESRDRERDKFNSVDVSHFNSQRISFSAQNDFAITDDHLLTLGYDYLDDRVDSSTAFAVTGRKNQAVFSQYQGNFAQHQIILGVREDFNEQFGNYTTWNAAWGYAFTNGIELSASYGTAFKAPTFNELYFPNFSNPNLDPERSESYEVGVQGSHDWGHWSLNGYLTNINDLIALDSTFIPQNISKARILGLEAIAGTELYGFTLQAQYSLMKPENLAQGSNHGNLLSRRAEQVFRLDIDRHFGPYGWVGPIGLGATVIAEGRRFDDLANTRRVAGFVTLDLRAEYEIIEQLVVQAKVNNILDKQYQTVAGFNTDGLNVFFNIKYSPSLF